VLGYSWIPGLKLGHLSKPPIIDESYYEKWIKDNNHEIPDVPHKYLSETR
jgi:hypothetical protein